MSSSQSFTVVALGLSYDDSDPNYTIPFQDDVSYPGKPFAVGLTLEALSAHTVDESGKEAFVTQNPLKLLRKVRQPS